MADMMSDGGTVKQESPVAKAINAQDRLLVELYAAVESVGQRFAPALRPQQPEKVDNEKIPQVVQSELTNALLSHNSRIAEAIGRLKYVVARSEL